MSPSPTVVDFLAVLVMVAIRFRTSAGAGRSPSTMDTLDLPPEQDVALERALATVGWAEGTRVDWDRHVRPVLAREFTELLAGRRDPGAPSEPMAGERMFGPDLWRWVDPSRPFTPEPDRPGPGREGLNRILDRLERL